MTYPNLCVVDTNVAKTANLAAQPDATSDTPPKCVSACIEAIEHVINSEGLIMDDGGEIFNEYLRHLSVKGQPGVGDCFIKWVHDKQWSLPDSQRVAIKKNNGSYNEFPAHSGLTDFDKDDHKFVAVSNAHSDKPTILQATDSKWWGCKDALCECGITVQFICPDYIEDKHHKKQR